MGKYNTQKGLLSELQWEILRHVCATNGANYKSIGGKTGKARTTIIQSINSLIKDKFIEKVDLRLSHNKHRIIFVPTYKGKSYAWDLTRPRMSVNEIFNTETDDDILSYIEAINQISEPGQREPMFYEFASNLLNSPIINKKGDITTEDKISSMKVAFVDGVLESIQNSEYNAKNMFHYNMLNWLNKFFSAAELEELIEKLSKIADNANSTIKLLSNVVG